MDWEKKDLLIQCFLALEKSEEVKEFLIDLWTVKEIEEFSNRLRAAEMLMAKTPYAKIIREAHASSATVARVSRAMKNSGGGYKTIIKRVHAARKRAKEQYPDI